MMSVVIPANTGVKLTSRHSFSKRNLAALAPWHYKDTGFPRIEVRGRLKSSAEWQLLVIPANAGIQHPSRHSVVKRNPASLPPWHTKDTGLHIKCGMTGLQGTEFPHIVVRGTLMHGTKIKKDPGQMDENASTTTTTTTILARINHLSYHPPWRRFDAKKLAITK